jgi:hypothetical protein
VKSAIAILQQTVQSLAKEIITITATPNIIDISRFVAEHLERADRNIDTSTANPRFNVVCPNTRSQTLEPHGARDDHDSVLSVCPGSHQLTKHAHLDLPVEALHDS